MRILMRDKRKGECEKFLHFKFYTVYRAMRNAYLETYCYVTETKHAGINAFALSKLIDIS